LHSQNRKFGESFITGTPYDKLAEGAATVKALMKLSEKYRVELPISQTVYNVIYNNADPKKALYALFERGVKQEFATHY
ncbi:MAG: glycerol-3-phosphate dehydrogenase, partial [Oscillospiraceae bacterium]